MIGWNDDDDDGVVTEFNSGFGVGATKAAGFNDVMVLIENCH